MSLEELYQEVILDHFKNPRCQGCVKDPHATFSMNNPLCGDKIQVSVVIHDKNIADLAFSGEGCSISQASASMMASLIKGKSISDVKRLSVAFKQIMRGELSPDQVPELGDAVSLTGVRKFAARIKCALLAWEALDRCVDKACDTCRICQA